MSNGARTSCSPCSTPRGWNTHTPRTKPASSAAANQAVYVSAVAQHTKNIRLSALVYVLPLHHLVRLIEETRMLDQISGGRFEVGVGRDTDRAQELRMWGGNAEENNARFDESLDVLV